MKKILLILLIISLIVFVNSTAQAKTRVGYGVGKFGPEDPTVTDHFADNDYINFYNAGINENGVELRTDFGLYEDKSHHPDDVDYNLRINMLNVRLALIKHFNDNPGAWDPYLGVGYGIYMYSIKDSFVGNIDSGSILAPSLIAGINYNFNENAFLTFQYSKHYLPKIFFDEAANFNSHSFYVGIGFQIDNGEGKGCTIGGKKTETKDTATTKTAKSHRGCVILCGPGSKPAPSTKSTTRTRTIHRTSTKKTSNGTATGQIKDYEEYKRKRAEAAGETVETVEPKEAEQPQAEEKIIIEETATEDETKQVEEPKVEEKQTIEEPKEEKDDQGHHWGTDEKEDSHDIEHKNDNQGKYSEEQ